MDKKYIDDNAIRIKYLRNQLNAEELEQFEIYMLNNPDIIEELELDEVFLSKSEIQTPVTPSGPNLLFSNRLLQSAFSMLVGVALTFAFFSQTTSESPELGYLNLSTSSRGNLPSMEPVTIEFSSKSSRIFRPEKFLLVIPVEAGSSTPMRVEISDTNSKSGHSERVYSDLKANVAGNIVLTLNAASYQPSIYKVSLYQDKRNVGESAFKTQFAPEPK